MVTLTGGDLYTPPHTYFSVPGRGETPRPDDNSGVISADSNPMATKEIMSPGCGGGGNYWGGVGWGGDHLPGM